MLNFFILIIIFMFSMWIIGGNIYNYSEEKESERERGLADRRLVPK